MYRADVKVPAEIDRAILNRARAHLARRGRFSLLLRVGGAAAAVLVIAASLLPWLNLRNRAVALRGDLNGDGVVDIRDALLLARDIDSKQTKASDDVNGDKVVDRRDVDAVAMMAVRIDKGAVQ